MPVDRISIAGAVLAVIALLFITVFIMQQPFQSFVYAQPSDHFIDISQDIGAQESQFMWSFRVTDLMAQALAIFAASVACLAMLRGREKEGGS
jgi:multisubunit Na+/H+ antiporter MnhB subunit